MSQRQREQTQQQHATSAPGNDGAGDGLDAMRANAERLLQSADDIIARALSSDSERFLEATRQSSGE